MIFLRWALEVGGRLLLQFSVHLVGVFVFGIDTTDRGLDGNIFSHDNWLWGVGA
jgi:hypothetical protein